ncbi:MAG: tRNA (guanosine(37)-N1)-methyltransferase TrmD [candidate division Zixibacteria bacterium]|nr:tRNA (guanosine(37)-N1)-methyltransferase TrmD [candidate division Zixibacteria bacterium]
MKVEIITLFPEYFDSIVGHSIVGRGIEDKLFEIRIINLRDYTLDKHQTADDKPFGGGGGMVLKIEPLAGCLRDLGCGERSTDKNRIVLTSAAGKKFDQSTAVEYSLLDRLTIICGHYLGVDERLLEMFEIDEVSLGDYVLTGGEPAAAVMTDAVVRLIPGVLGNFESALSDSHSEKILGTPVYTRPEEFEGLSVPEVLTEGNHRLITKFRRQEAIKKTLKNRPELLENLELEEDKEILNRLRHEKDEE